MIWSITAQKCMPTDSFDSFLSCMNNFRAYWRGCKQKIIGGAAFGDDVIIAVTVESSQKNDGATAPPDPPPASPGAHCHSRNEIQWTHWDSTHHTYKVSNYQLKILKL